MILSPPQVLLPSPGRCTDQIKTSLSSRVPLAHLFHCRGLQTLGQIQTGYADRYANLGDAGAKHCGEFKPSQPGSC